MEALQGPKPSLGIPWAWPMERERIAVGPFIGVLKFKKYPIRKMLYTHLGE